ncbi:MAG: hypothetical protein WKG00_15855 [Polyangiaceae bacterium]
MTARRSVPPIDPRDLRHLADGERVERIWERLEPSLVVAPPRRRAHRRDLALGLLAASLSAFGVGLVVGKAFYEAPAPVAVPSPVTTGVERVEVFAAGTQPRAYALPGGGEVRLTPGTTVELEKGEGGASPCASSRARPWSTPRRARARWRSSPARRAWPPPPAAACW